MVFDPGIDEDSLMVLDAVSSTLCHVYGARPASFREGEFKCGNITVKMFDILFDSGALHHSFIKAEIVEKNREHWGHAIRPHETTVKLADQKTLIKTSEMIAGELSFVSDGGREHKGQIDAIVWNMKDMDLILGLPDIIKNFITLFFLMLKQHQNELNASAEFVTDMRPGETRQWSTGFEEECPEEQHFKIPVAHEPILTFMETKYEDARAAYMGMLKEHVGSALKNHKPLWDLLRSDLAVDRFVPKEWVGITGFEPLELQWKDTFPESHPVRSRPINQRLWEVAKKEFDRLCAYTYRESTSPWASPLVTASKATAPFVRFCGDYVWLNHHLVMPQAYIPRVQHEIEKMAGFSIFLDIDMTNAFHQFPLAAETSRRLAIQTPWGLVEPTFMPEGISPASGYLQTMMRKMFGDMDEFAVVIFDNILLGATTPEDAVNKFKRFLERAKKHNVFLKMAKTWLGFENVKFFGYLVSRGKYEMDEGRKKAIMEFVMPTSAKSMQRFLGSALFFKSFVPNYSDVAASLHEMTHDKFVWDKRTWSKDYHGAFNHMKKALEDSVACYFPDYELPWTLRVDASKVAVGAVLFQTRTLPDGTTRNEPIGFASQKFSATAQNWDPHKQEAYALAFGVDYFAYYLRGKAFVLETDHRNLMWIEKSESPIVVRWRLNLQSFCLFIRHIAGTKNLVADWLTRMVACLFGVSALEFVERESEYADISCLMSLLTMEELDFDSPLFAATSDESLAKLAQATPPGYTEAVGPMEKPVVQQEAGVEQYIPFTREPEAITVPELPAVEVTGRGKDVTVTREVVWTAEQMFQEVHGGRKMHWGARRTWQALNRRFPGHGIPFRFVQDKIEECIVCKLYRNSFDTHVEKIYSHIKPSHPRARVGFDGLTVTPADEHGNTHLIVVVDFFKKYVWGYVAKDYSAKSVATALLVYYCTFGVYDEVWSDSGSNILSDVVEQLNKWLQVSHVVALVDRHQTCGTEGSNKQILRHLRTIVFDERVKSRWSDPTVLCLVFFVINDQVNSETGVRPLDAMFGSVDGPYLRLPADALPADITNAWVVALDQDLKTIRRISADYQRSLIDKRTAETPEATQNRFQPGDIVLWERDKSKPLPTKMDAPFRGPYEVIEQKRNIVMCKHLIMGTDPVPLHVERLQLHVGSKDDAIQAALRDEDQFVVVRVSAWKGNPKKRTGMSFWVEYDDGDAMWVRYKPDLVANQAYQDFIHETPELFPLRYNAIDVARFSAAYRLQPITTVKPGDRFYADLRVIMGTDAFDELQLPNAYFIRYVCFCEYIRWIGKDRKFIEAGCPLLDAKLVNWSSLEVYMHGSLTVFSADNMILLTEALCLQHPTIIPTRSRRTLYRLFQSRTTAPTGGGGEGGVPVALATV